MFMLPSSVQLAACFAYGALDVDAKIDISELCRRRVCAAGRIVRGVGNGDPLASGENGFTVYNRFTIK